MRIYATAQRKQGITEPAKEIELATGTFVTANFVVPGKPKTERSTGTKDIVVAITVPSDNKRMVENLKKMSQVSPPPALEECNLLVTGFVEVIQDYLLSLEASALDETAKDYVERVTNSFTWGPGGFSGTADVVLYPTTMDVISKKVIARRSQLMTDATVLRTQRDENGTPRVTKNGNKLKQLNPCYKSFISPGVTAGRCRVWSTKATLEMFQELPDEDTVVSIEGELVKKSWKTDDGEERTNLEVQAKLLFFIGLKVEKAYMSVEEQAEVSKADTTGESAEVQAMNQDDDDDDIVDDY